MQTYLRDQVDWPQAFPATEYAERRAKVCAALQEAGLDAIYITAPANINWLTGYDMIDFHLEILTGDGTNKRLVKFTGDHTVDDSLVTDTGTKVGINQTSPQKTLDVKGDLKVSGDFLWGGSAFTSSSCVVMGGNSCSSACSQHGMSCTKAWAIASDSTSTSCSQSGFKFCCCH